MGPGTWSPWRKRAQPTHDDSLPQQPKKTKTDVSFFILVAADPPAKLVHFLGVFVKKTLLVFVFSRIKRNDDQLQASGDSVVSF